jgi:hypothetical protein
MDRTQSEIAELISRHLAELRKPGVLSLRPGFQVTNGWLTGRPAIVATVNTKIADPPDARELPREIEGTPVDVRQASAVKRERILDPAAYAQSGRTTPDVGAVPEFASEIDLVGVEPRLLGLTALPEAGKPSLPYTPPAGAALTPVTGTISVTLSASPDSGWPTLKPFLGATTENLTVSMYDFTSAHILSEVKTAMTGKELKLTLDHPARNPTADQTDEQTDADLAAALGSKLQQAWALERMDPKATAYIFPTAYHIKVAVQDSQRMWLSSGNWNNSNQPDIDPVTTPGDATAARSGDRDWHVIIEHPELSKTFEAFMVNDLQIAGEHNIAPATTAALVAETRPNLQTPPFSQFFAAQTVTDQMTITPVLTPDPGVYVDAVKALIESATVSLHMQFQYIELPKTASATSQAFIDLVDTVIARQAAGVDVKIIMSEFETAGFLEQLQAAGLDVVTNVKLQNNVHNKGIVVDGTSVLISSQNWSTDGTLYNRDAGVIVENAKVAAYYEQLFQHDWENLSIKKTADD